MRVFVCVHMCAYEAVRVYAHIYACMLRVAVAKGCGRSSPRLLEANMNHPHNSLLGIYTSCLLAYLARIKL